MSDNRNYDYSISVIRVLAMFFIIICHLANKFGQNVIAQFFNVGVHIFFLISGYLYGSKTIQNKIQWLCKRYIRLFIPSILWLFVTVVFSVLYNKDLPQTHEVVFLILNLQGLNFIFSIMKDLFIGPWFFTNIMGCYILLALFHYFKDKNEKIDKIFLYGGIFPLLVFIILGRLQISTDGALCFFIGYNLSNKKLLTEHKNRNVFISIICFFISVFLRIVANRLVDETILYNEIVSPLTHIGIASSVLVGIKWLFGIIPDVLNVFASSKFIKHLDRISIYVYLFHPMFFNGTIIDIFAVGISLPVALIIYLSVTILFSSIIMFMGEFLSKRIDFVIEKYCF